MDFELQRHSCYCFVFPVWFDHVCRSLVKVLILSFVNFGEFILSILLSFGTGYEFNLELVSNVSDQRQYRLNSFIYVAWYKFSMWHVSANWIWIIEWWVANLNMQVLLWVSASLSLLV